MRVSLNNPSGFLLGLLLPLCLLLLLAATAATLDLLGFVVKAGLWGSVEAGRSRIQVAVCSEVCSVRGALWTVDCAVCSVQCSSPQTGRSW